MNTEDNKLPDDKQLSSLYGQAKDDMPAAHIDDAILSAAKRETSSYSLPYSPFSNNWHIPASLAAVLVLSFGIVTLMENDLSPVDSVIPFTTEEADVSPQPLELTDKLVLAEKKSQRSKKSKKPAIQKPVKPRRLINQDAGRLALGESFAQQPAATPPNVSSITKSDIEKTQGLLAQQQQEKSKRKEVSRKREKSLEQTIERDSLAAAMSSGQSIATTGLISSGIDEQTTLPYWQYQDQGISIRFIQRLPDQTRGYFIARGFSSENTELIAQSCAFQTVFKNISNDNTPSPVTYHMRNWVITHQGKMGEMKTREKWAKQWQQLNIATPAKLAFNWSLLPTTQDYQPGDYSWGMAIFDLKPAQSFSLLLTWQQHGKQHRATIPDMQCAADIHAEPEAP